ncbi:MAG: flotillin family protein [Lachnospiraceae bacterium]|nr:flotillin family protein [Lachnospiraceae bacterium]
MEILDLLSSPFFIAGAVAVFLIILLFIAGYKKASPDEAIIISGLRKTPKILKGKAGLMIPFFEKSDKLNLALQQVDIKTTSAVPTADYINIKANATVGVKISDNPDLIKKAAQNFLNKDSRYIAVVAQEILEGNIREIIGTMTLTDMISDKKTFGEKVETSAKNDLASIGLEITSFNVQDFSDNGLGVIDNLGVDNVVAISKTAAISRAQSEKEISVAQSKAEKEANDARVEADLEIAKRNTELAIQKAELQRESDIKKAEADAAYSIQQQEQQKTIEVTTANALLAKQEKEIELKAKEVEITERKLEADIKKKAEADKYAIQQKADAELYDTQKKADAELFERQKKAEADKYEALQKAEAKKAESEALKIAMENEAAGIKAKGVAEAEAIQAKAEAEAAGILKKAEAMKQYGEAAQMDMQLEALKVYFEQLPKIAESVASPMSQIDSIKMFGNGNTAKLTGDIMTTITQVTDGIKESTGIDPMSILAGFLGGKMGNTANITSTDDATASTKRSSKADNIDNTYSEIK